MLKLQINPQVHYITRPFENEFVMTLIGATVVTITGTLGGSLNGTPSLVTKTIGKLGWEVYMTFYLPTWMLWAFGLGAVAIVALGLLGRRAHA